MGKERSKKSTKDHVAKASRKPVKRPVKKKAAADRRGEMAYREIKARILQGDMLPGATYLEQELAGWLKMSRTPIREALVRLQEENLLEIRPRRGVQVQPISLEDMKDIYQILSVIEAEAARHVATQKIDEETLAALEATARDMNEALEKDDRDSWAAADRRFHRLLVTLSGNKKLIAMAESLLEQAHRARMATLFLRPKPSASTAEHISVINAIRRGDATAARDLHMAHHGRVLKEMMFYLQQARLKNL